MQIKKIHIILILVLFSSELFSQGFSWQYSYRMPSKSPIGFIGINANAGISNDFGGIDLFEFYIPCCTFNSGTSRDISIGGIGEYWFSPIEAVNVRLNYFSNSGEYNSDSEPVYYKNDTMATHYLLSKSVNYLAINLAYKRRILESHFSISGGLDFYLLLSNSYSIKEKISSGDLTFNDGSQERDVKNGKISDLSGIIISPKIGFGYDFELGKSVYSNAELFFNYTLNSISNENSWRAIKISLGFTCLLGILE